MESVLLPWVIAVTILFFVAIYWLYTQENRLKILEARYKKILALAEDADEATIVQVLIRMDEQAECLKRVEGQIARFDRILPHTIQGYGVVRYSAFPDVGGDQSFSMALVDEHGNGVMVSGLHGRDATRVYSKPLTQWRSNYSLGAEEQQALGKARQMVEGEPPAEG